MVTRKQVLKGMAGLVAAGSTPALAVSSSENSARARGMLLAAKSFYVGGVKKYTARDYVQTGLVAMWDGIENAGWGTHDASATTWKDLSGNGYDAVLYGGGLPTWMADGYSFSANCFNTNSNFGENQKLTIECVFSCNSNTNSPSSPFSNVQGGGCGFQITNSRNDVWYAVGKPGGGYYSVFYAPITFGKRMSCCIRVGNSFDGIFNGENIGSCSSSGVRFNSNVKYFIGAEAYSSGIEKILDGDVFCVRYYGRALTDEQIAANYAVDKARFNLA